MNKDNFICVGHGVPSVDALDKVLGRAVYSEDIAFPDMLYGRMLRAGIPHAIIEEIDILLPGRMKGVAASSRPRTFPEPIALVLPTRTRRPWWRHGSAASGIRWPS